MQQELPAIGSLVKRPHTYFHTDGRSLESFIVCRVISYAGEDRLNLEVVLPASTPPPRHNNVPPFSEEYPHGWYTEAERPSFQK